MIPDIDIDWSRQKILALVLVVLVASPAVAPALAAVQTVFVSGQTPIVTQSGLEIKPGPDGQYDLKEPWKSSNELELRNVTFEGRNTSAVVDNFGDPANGGVWTNASNINTDSDGRIIINRSDGRAIGANGGVDELRVRDSNLSQNNDNVDAVVSASTGYDLIVNDTGLSQGTGVVAVNADTGEALDSAPVNSNGDLVLDQLEATNGQTKINLRTGPSELRVYEESNPNTLVTDATLRVRVFDDGEVFERDVSNGRMDLTGIPTDQRLTITVEGDGSDYVYRRITIPSTAEQQEVYLINGTNNNELATVNFQIQDKTGGDFSTADTEFIIEKAIRKDFDGDGSDETRYQAVSGDTIGSSGEYAATLEVDERYRLRARNNNGDSRVLGSYVVRANDAPVVTIGEVSISADTTQGYAVDVRTFLNDSNGDGTDEQFVTVEYVDADEGTEELRYELVNQTGNTTIINEAISGPIGTHTATFKVADNATPAATYRLDWEATQEVDNGSSITVSGTQYAGDVPTIGGQLPIDDRWLSLIALVSVVAVAGLVVIFDSSLAAIASTGWASLLTILGVVAIPMPALGLAGAISVIALVGRAR